MRKLLVLLTVLICGSLYAQTATDANGNKIYNKNSLAIFTRVTKFAVSSTSDIKKVLPGDLEEELRVALNTMATSGAQNHGIQVVNRDDATFRMTQAWLDETKSEDYLDGLSVRARKIGASHILVQDITVYTYGHEYFVFEIMYNVISVQTNVSTRNVRRYKVSVTGSQKEISDMIAAEKSAIRKYYMDAFPGFFVLQKTSGNTALLAATSAFGIDAPDKIYFYYYDNVQLPLHGQMFNAAKLEVGAIGTNPKVVNGYLQVKLDRKLTRTNDLIIKLGDLLHSEIGTYLHVPVAFIDLKLTGNPADDYCIKQANNAAYNALYDYACINLIESEELKLVKAERELQKSEDFIDGAVIEQFKACGAEYVMNLSEFSQKDRIVNCKLSVLNVAEGTVEKEFLINCHVSNLDEVMKYYINMVFVTPIAIGDYSKKQINVYPMLPVASEEGELFTILYNKPINNPVSGDTIYNRVEIAKGRLTKWNVHEYVISIDKILSKDDYEAIANNKSNGLYYLQKELTEPQNVMEDNTEKNWKKK